MLQCFRYWSLLHTNCDSVCVRVRVCVCVCVCVLVSCVLINTYLYACMATHDSYVHISVLTACLPCVDIPVRIPWMQSNAVVLYSGANPYCIMFEALS